MLGLVARTAPAALFAAVIAAVLARVMDPITNIIYASPNVTATTSFAQGLEAASNSNNFLLVGLIAFVLTIVGRAFVEAKL
jgi:hypothetical protein